MGDVTKKLAPTTTKDGKNKKNKNGPKSQQQQQSEAQQPPHSKPAPGSWASLVVSGSSAPNTPSRNTAQLESKNRTTKPPLPSVDTKEKELKENGTSAAKEASGHGGSGSNNQNKITTSNNSSSTNTKNNSGGGGSSNGKTNTKSQQQQRTKRDPDNTLVIKNLSDNIKEHDIINMFQPYAVQTKSKIVGTNLNHHRSLAFVDYDCVAPVLAALKKHAGTPFEWNGKILEVDQKTLEQRARRKAGLSNNSNNNSSNNNGYRTGGGGGIGNAGRGGGGGGDQYNRRSGGGDRGGRRRGNRAGR